MKQVFLSADDFGRSPNRNKAIDESFKKGLIKSAGLIMTGQYLKDAVNLMNMGGYVEHVHCHLNVSGNINGEDSLDKPLTEKMAKDRSFCENGLYKPYNNSLPYSPSDLFKWHKVYMELCAQYNLFLQVTEGKGDSRHVDFHLWYNLTWPVSIALNVFTWTHRIKTVRYIGVQLEHTKRRIFRILSWNPFVKSYRSSNIDGFLTHPEWFEKEKHLELYCHPDYMVEKGDVMMDNSISYFKHEKKSMAEHIELLKKYDLEFVSWNL